MQCLWLGIENQSTLAKAMDFAIFYLKSRILKLKLQSHAALPLPKRSVCPHILLMHLALLPTSLAALPCCTALPAQNYAWI